MVTSSLAMRDQWLHSSRLHKYMSAPTAIAASPLAQHRFRKQSRVGNIVCCAEKITLMWMLMQSTTLMVAPALRMRRYCSLRASPRASLRVRARKQLSMSELSALVELSDGLWLTGAANAAFQTKVSGRCK